jgi:hypothetical protein
MSRSSLSSFAVSNRVLADEALSRSNASGGTERVISSGTTTLVAGVSPTIHTGAPITATSKFLFALKAVNASTALGIPSAISVVVANPGSFQLASSEVTSPGTEQTGDVSTYNWFVLDTQ